MLLAFVSLSQPYTKGKLNLDYIYPKLKMRVNL